MKDNKKKLSIILNVITIICGLLALILQLIGGVGFNNPFIWVLVLLVITSVASLLTISSK